MQRAALEASEAVPTAVCDAIFKHPIGQMFTGCGDPWSRVISTEVSAEHLPVEIDDGSA